jgi:hypothetical protein
MTFSSSTRLLWLPHTEKLPRTTPHTEGIPELPRDPDPRAWLWSEIVTGATVLQTEGFTPLAANLQETEHLVARDLFLAVMHYYSARPCQRIARELVPVLRSLVAACRCKDSLSVSLALTSAVAIIGLSHIASDAGVQHELAVTQRWLYFA